MILRRRNAPRRYLDWRVGLFFLAAGLWVTSLITGPDWLALAALGALAVALVLGVLAGREEKRHDGEDDPPEADGSS